MKIELKKFRLSSLTYNSIDDLEKIFGENPPEKFSVKEKRSISSEYALKKDKKGLLVSTEIKLNSIPDDATSKVEDGGIQNLVLCTDAVFALTSVADEESVVEEFDSNDLVDKFRDKVDLIVEMKSNEMLNFVINNGPWSKTQNFFVSFDVDLKA